MLADQTITFIGGGHISEIIISNLTQRGVVAPENITVCDPDWLRCQLLIKHYGVKIAPNNTDAAQRGNFIMICVRPEVVKKVLPDLKAAHLHPDQVIVSVAAGIPLSTYKPLGDQQFLVRALPNPPSQIGEGIAPLVFSGSVTHEKRQLVFDLFSSLGEWVEVDESFFNAITSLSSPVATYLFFQSLIDAGLECGLPETVATKIAAQTITGSIEVWKSRQVLPSDLINEASTPGGVSVESIHVLKEYGFPQAVVKAIITGAARSEELGQGEG